MKTLISFAVLMFVGLFIVDKAQASQITVYQDYAETLTVVARLKSNQYTSCEATSKDLTEKFEEHGYEVSQYWFATRGKDRRIFQQKEMQLFNSRIVFKCYN